MKKITKEMCISFIKDYYKSNPIAFVVFSIFALVALWFFTENIAIVSILALAAVALAAILIYRTNKKVNNINSEDFYLTEDVVVDFKKRHTHSKAGGSGRDYIYTFRDYGKYTIHKSAHPTIEIPLHKEKNISHLSVEALCIESGEKGAIYYLLIAKKKEGVIIIKCFPKYNFDIAQEDFDYISEKYYCKKQEKSSN